MFHDSEKEAKDRAEQALELESDCAADGGWNDHVVEICWGKVEEKVVRTSVKKAPPGSVFDELWNYELVRVADE